MTTYVLAVLIGAVAGAVAVEAVRIHRQVTSIDPPEQVFERTNPYAATRVLFLGDSTGYGVGSSDVQHTITGRIGAEYPDLSLENKTQGQLTLRGARKALQDLRTSTDHVPYDLVILMVGGMNIVYGTPLFAARRSLRALIDEAKQCGDQVLVIGPNNTGLLPLYRFPLSTFLTRRARAFRALFAETTREKEVGFASLFHERHDPLVEQHLFSKDGAHPTDAGYAIWYDHIQPVLARYLRKT